MRVVRARGAEGGFTLIELMVALTILIIGLLGLMGIVMVSLRASSFSRHGTEAAVLAEDKIEELRTMAVPVGATESAIDAQGNAGGIYSRQTTVTTVNFPDIGDMLQIVVTVSWNEQEQGSTTGAVGHSVQLTTERMP
jgi:type IV pilus assembly protein PilV